MFILFKFEMITCLWNWHWDQRMFITSMLLTWEWVWKMLSEFYVQFYSIDCLGHKKVTWFCDRAKGTYLIEQSLLYSVFPPWNPKAATLRTEALLCKVKTIITDLSKWTTIREVGRGTRVSRHKLCLIPVLLVLLVRQILWPLHTVALGRWKGNW